ncbi:UNVERIFIED_CONTAM: hypothetical protein Sradi_1284500 [Sesamum radiatum]|uniref:Uncharacterized protein n=1 Tax=Sesamum radiatum TaxID=300843 RepID=A0AAW2UQZ6_SESRA
MWQQRSKAHWLWERDRNTKFFHATTTTRKRRNAIVWLKDDRGMWREHSEGIQELLLGYFHHIFSSSNPYDSVLETALNTVTPRVMAEMNQSLIQPFTAQEIRNATFSMASLKSPILMARDEAINSIKRILEVYEHASGQQIHLEKSSMIVNPNVRLEQERARMAAILEVQLVAKHDKYLDLPAIAGRSLVELSIG